MRLKRPHCWILLLLALALATSCKDDRLTLPSAGVLPDAVSLTAEAPTAQVDIYSSWIGPNGTLYWEVSQKPDWLQVSPASGDIRNDYKFTVTAFTNDLPVGFHTGKVTITTTTGIVELPVSLEIKQSTAMELTPDSVVIGATENSRSVTLKNKSSHAINWQLVPSAAYVTLVPASGLLSQGQSTTITVSVDRSNLETQVYMEHMSLTLDGIANGQYPITISHFEDTNWALSGQVIDAEYDRTADNLILVTNENKLLKLKPESKTQTEVMLPLTPKCVSVGMGGQYAVVGHNASVTLVNLTTMQIEQTYAVSTNPIDIVLGPNFWAYVFPSQSTWENIRCINLLNGAESLHTGFQIYGGTKARLHPSGDYIYGANNGLSPSDAEKYDIRGGQAAYMYDSPYHGDYYFSGNLWFTDTGSKMFSRGRASFTLSSTQAQDMIFEAYLPASGGIETLDHHSVKNRIYAVTTDPNSILPVNQVTMYVANPMSLIGTKQLQDFLINTSGGPIFSHAQGHYGFFNSAGTKYFIVVKAASAVDQAAPWAIETIDVN